MDKHEKTAQKRFYEADFDANGEISRLTLKCERLEEQNRLLKGELERLRKAYGSLQAQLDDARQGRWDQRTCKACGKVIDNVDWYGRQREYCNHACRQRAYRKRKRA